MTAPLPSPHSLAVRAVEELNAGVRDTAVERENHRRNMADRDGESFTATTDCPNCGHMAVHWLTEPRLMPMGDDPADIAWRRISLHAVMLGFNGWRFDPPGCTVARVCVKCDHRWGQR